MCGLTLLPSPAHACVRGAVSSPTYAIDPALQASDRQAPSPFTEVAAFAFKVEDTVCRGNRCTTTSCGDSGGIEITFADPADDQTLRDQLGYRIVVIGGVLPRSMVAGVDTVRPLPSALFFEVGFDEVARLDAVIALIAVDHAGNESAPSAPIELRDSGCTRTFLSAMCIEETDAGDLPADCSVRAVPSRNGSWLIATLPLAALALIRRGRRCTQAR